MLANLKLRLQMVLGALVIAPIAALYLLLFILSDKFKRVKTRLTPNFAIRNAPPDIVSTMTLIREKRSLLSDMLNSMTLFDGKVYTKLESLSTKEKCQKVQAILELNKTDLEKTSTQLLEALDSLSAQNDPQIQFLRQKLSALYNLNRDILEIVQAKHKTLINIVEQKTFTTNAPRDQSFQPLVATYMQCRKEAKQRELEQSNAALQACSMKLRALL